MYPELGGLSHVIKVNNVIKPDKFELNNSIEWTCLKRDHITYAFLARGFDSFIRKDCLFEAICASSTDNYPEESIQNTLEPSDSVDNRVSYWSSEGESNHAVPETLLYKLTSNLCVITEIHVQPFQGVASLQFSRWLFRTFCIVHEVISYMFLFQPFFSLDSPFILQRLFDFGLGIPGIQWTSKMKLQASLFTVLLTSLFGHIPHLNFQWFK